MRGVIPSPSVVAAKAARPLQQKCDSAVAHKFCPEKKLTGIIGQAVATYIVQFPYQLHYNNATQYITRFCNSIPTLLKLDMTIGTVPTHYKDRIHFFSTDIRYLCSIL